MSNKRGTYQPGKFNNNRQGQKSGKKGAAKPSPTAGQGSSNPAFASAPGVAQATGAFGTPGTPDSGGDSALMPEQRTAASQEAKREARFQRQAIARAAAERQRRVKTLRRWTILAALVIAVVGGTAWFFINEANKPGESVGQMASPHLASVTTPHEAYSTDPPTSGPHVTSMASWGTHSTPLVKEEEVHNLEDGGVVISYREDLDKATLDQLTTLVSSYDTQVVMAPYPGLSTPIALTAWGRIERLDSLDATRIKQFINEYRGKDHHAQSGS